MSFPFGRKIVCGVTYIYAGLKVGVCSEIELDSLGSLGRIQNVRGPIRM